MICRSIYEIPCNLERFVRLVSVDLRSDADVGMTHEPRRDIDRDTGLFEIRAVCMSQIIKAERLLHRMDPDDMTGIVRLCSELDVHFVFRAIPELPER